MHEVWLNLYSEHKFNHTSCIAWHGANTFLALWIPPGPSPSLQDALLTAVGLVGLVRAVGLLVAPPVRRDAARVVELVLGARELAGITVGRG